MIGRAMSAWCSCMCVLGEDTCNTPPLNRASTPTPPKTSKSKTQLWPCSTCQAHCRGYRGIHQSARTVADINYPELRSISPQFALLLHACPITFLTAHYKGQGDTRLTKERNTNWNIFSASNMSSLLESCSLHLFLINVPTFVPLRFKAKLFVRQTSQTNNFVDNNRTTTWYHKVLWISASSGVSGNQKSIAFLMGRSPALLIILANRLQVCEGKQCI